MKKPMTLDTEQLELLRDFTNFPILQIFTEPSNASDVAKSLKMPANTLHYRVKKLYEAGLLKLVEQKGRRRSYKSVATNFRVHRDILQNAEQPYNLGNDALSKVTKGFDQAQSEYIDKHVDEGKDPGYIHFGIDDSGEQLMSNYEPCLGIFDMPLSQEQYRKLTKTLLEIAHEIKNEKQNVKNKQCTVAIVAFPKSSAVPTLN
jgi:DNA-binding Lrp family transcriptional regulator